MKDVTGEEVKAAMIAANITRVDHHECGGCGHMVFYSRIGEFLYFHPACDCSYSLPEPREWESAAGWINMQSYSNHKAKLRAAFGFSPETPTEKNEREGRERIQEIFTK